MPSAACAGRPDLREQTYRSWPIGREFGTCRRLFLGIGPRGIRDEKEVDLRAVRSDFRVVEIPYHYMPRATGESKTAINPLGYISRGWNYVATILRLRFE